MINGRLDIKLEHFLGEEFGVALEKKGKAAKQDEILSEIWKARKFDDILVRLSNAVY